MKTFVILYDNQDCISIPMAWDEECDGAVSAWHPGRLIAQFPDRKSAERAIRISTRFAALQREMGKPANEDFLEFRKHIKIVPLAPIREG